MIIWIVSEAKVLLKIKMLDYGKLNINYRVLAA